MRIRWACVCVCAHYVPCCPLTSTLNCLWVGLSHSQPPLSIADIQSTLTSFLPSSVSSLSSFLSLSAPLSPQITAVFTRALRDLPTRPRVRSHSPHQAKKNPPKSYQASCLLTHWLPVCGCDVPVCVCVGACCVSHAAYRNSLSTKSSFPPSLTLSCLILCIVSPCFLGVECHWSPCKPILLIPPHPPSFLPLANLHMHSQAYIVLPATVKSQWFSADHLLFLWRNINTRSCPMWTLDGGDRTITVLQHTYRCLTIQTCSISVTPCSIRLAFRHRQQQGK